MDAAAPLAGRTVVVTRATDQASTLVDALTRLGADVVAVPVIAIVDASDEGAALAAALRRVAEFDWVVVTSANGGDRLVGSGVDLSAVQVAAIGPGTADALARHGVEAALMPERFVAEGLLAAFPAPPANGGRVLLAQAAGARPVLREELVAAGWDVEAVEAYRTVHPSIDAEQLAQATGADAITFTSASTVRGYVEAAGVEAVPPVVASIGPVTSEAARTVGLTVTIEAEEHTIPGLVSALVGWFGSLRR
ncbi:MAG: uroporphyrinogen-III synthase [Acidimicrobiia bacterium]|nr:uroporphyrinogen-III synthase [Acidimicrobiia bacterium]